jgi:hypothetical protein
MVEYRVEKRVRVSRQYTKSPGETFVLIGILTVSLGFGVCEAEVVGS